MEIEFPDFDYAPLEAFSICAFTEEEISIPGDRVILEAKISDFSEVVWMRLIINPQDDPKGFHVHIDLARELRFEESDVPTKNDSQNEILATLGSLEGRQLSAIPTAIFAVPAGEIGEANVLSVLLDLSVGEEDQNAQLSGADFSLSRGIVDRIQWRKSLRDGTPMIEAKVSGASDMIVSSTILSEAFDSLRDAFRSFILEDLHQEDSQRST